MKNLTLSYQSIFDQIEALISGESDLIANMANISSVLYHQLDNVNWAGFYIFKQNQLVLGPFHGQPACIRIDLNKGVCGYAAHLKKTTIVDDVHQFDGHIACDPNSLSEIVVPLVHKNKLIAVLDIDSPIKHRFTDLEASLLEQVANLLITKLDVV